MTKQEARKRINTISLKLHRLLIPTSWTVQEKELIKKLQEEFDNLAPLAGIIAS